MDHDALVNDFALRSFRDMADGDYIAARMACRAALLPQFLWASQQAVEKYLKCILLLNRIDAREAYHDLGKALDRIDASGKLSLDLTRGTKEFHRHARSMRPVSLFRGVHCRIRRATRDAR